MKKRVALTAFLAVSAVIGTAAQATNVVTWDATGTVNSGFTFDNSSGKLGDLHAGDTFNFIFSFDDEQNATPPGSGLYPRGYTADLTAVGRTFSAHFDDVGNAPSFVVNSGLGDSFSVNANDPTQAALLSLFTLFGGPLGSNALPTLAQANSFANQIFAFGSGGTGLIKDDGFTGMVSNISAVPLPAAAWLLISGLGGLAAFGRRRRTA